MGDRKGSRKWYRLREGQPFDWTWPKRCDRSAFEALFPPMCQQAMQVERLGAHVQSFEVTHRHQVDIGRRRA